MSNDLEGIYSHGESNKRRADVLERLHAGMNEKKIATDLGIPPHSVAEIVGRLRAEGALDDPPLPPPPA